MITVFHNPHFLDCALLFENDPLREKVLDQIGDLQKVAEVDSTNLDDAFRLTNNIDTPWTQNQGVQPAVERARSTSVGDVLSLDGTCWIVASLGFVELCQACPVSETPCPEYSPTQCRVACPLK